MPGRHLHAGRGGACGSSSGGGDFAARLGQVVLALQADPEGGVAPADALEGECHRRLSPYVSPRKMLRPRRPRRSLEHACAGDRLRVTPHDRLGRSLRARDGRSPLGARHPPSQSRRTLGHFRRRLPRPPSAQLLLRRLVLGDCGECRDHGCPDPVAGVRDLIRPSLVPAPTRTGHLPRPSVGRGRRLS